MMVFASLSCRLLVFANAMFLSATLGLSLGSRAECASRSCRARFLFSHRQKWPRRSRYRMVRGWGARHARAARLFCRMNANAPLRCVNIRVFVATHHRARVIAQVAHGIVATLALSLGRRLYLAPRSGYRKVSDLIGRRARVIAEFDAATRALAQVIARASPRIVAALGLSHAPALPDDPPHTH